MKPLIAVVLLLVTAIVFAQTPKVSYLPNQRFAQQIGDIEPIQWKAYEPMQMNVHKPRFLS